MKRRHHPLFALGLLAPACAPTPVAHRGSTAQAPAVTNPQPVTAGDRPDDEGVPTSSSSAPVPTTEPPATIATVSGLPPTTDGTTTTTVRPKPLPVTTLPENVDEAMSDVEWWDTQRGQVARVSWYGAESGSHTANGDRYNPEGLTFAHLSMAFGTTVLFRGPLGSVVATCTDRGPAAWTGKTFDLSRAAFARVAPLSAGVTEVTWEVVG